jgi:predicted Zn-dependent protease
MAGRIIIGIVVGLLAAAGAVRAAPTAPTLAERLERAERMQDWAAIERLSPGFALAQRGDVYAVTSILNACVARRCDTQAAIKRLRGPLVSDGVREFARAWVEYAAGSPAAARPRFEALAREPATAWLGAFGRLAYATDARNVALLAEAVSDAKADAVVAKALADDIATAEMSLAALQGDDERLAVLARAGGDGAGALAVRFTMHLAQDDFAAAEEVLRRYVRLYGEDQDAIMSRLELLRARRPPAEVVREARREVAAHPRYWRLRFSLAQSLIEDDDENGAREALSAAFPEEFAVVRLELSVIRSALSRLNAQEADAYAKALEPWRDQPEAMVATASVMLDVGRPEEAAALLDRADAMTDALPATLNVRARMAREAGREEEYVRLLERVAERSRREATPQLALALAYVKTGATLKAARIVDTLRHSPRYVSPQMLELLEKAVRDAEPSFRTAALRR